MKSTKGTRTKNEITLWLESAGRFPALPQERVTMIARQIQSLPEDSPKRKKLINTLVKHNLKLVARFVNCFMGSSCHNKWGSPETVDYLQVGTIGLIRAAELFDPARGYTFSTYANNWIRSKVARYNLTTKSPLYISETMTRKLIYFNRNGFLKARSSNEHLDEKDFAPILREVKNALSCSSLNVRNEFDQEAIDFIVCNKSQEEINDRNLFTDIHQELDKVGVTPLGKEILISFFVHEKPCHEIAKNLNITIHKVRSEKNIATRRARSSKALRSMV
jgi:RNA polymerase sigma factor (sigma-70 family)